MSSASPKFFVGVPFSRRALEMPFLKEVTKIKQIKIKHNTLLLIKFYQVENIKSITIFNSIVNALGRTDIPLTDHKVLENLDSFQYWPKWEFFLKKGNQKFHHPLLNPFSKCFASK